MFGMPGMFNHLNMLEFSPHFVRMLSGIFPAGSVKCKVGETIFDWVYYLGDGIYPIWKCFGKTFSMPGIAKEKIYSRRQEALGKCVESLFGVLFKRFHILANPSRLWDAGD